MEFKLKTGNNSNPILPTLASEEEIRANEIRGLTHIVYDGVSHFLYIDDSNHREKLKEYLFLKNYEWFHEETGNKNWVLYNTNQFHITTNMKGKKIVHFDEHNYNGSRLELPINASSCCGMFSWTTIPENMNWSNLFNTKDIVDMSLMFAGTNINDKHKSFSQFMKTDSLKVARYFLYDATLPSDFTFDLDLSNCLNFEYMFSRAKIRPGFKAPNFDISSGIDLTRMFFETKFGPNCSFGPGLDNLDGKITTEMFLGCIKDSKPVNSVYDLIM